MSHPLEPFGWTDAVAEAFARLATADAGPGRVVRVDRGGTWVETTSGQVLMSTDGPVSRAAGVELGPVTGDWVAVTGPAEAPAVVAILDRHGVLSRRDPADRLSEQVLAANVDVVLILAPCDRDVGPGWFERSLVLVHESGARPVIVRSKCDLASDGERVRAGTVALTDDEPVHLVSAITGDGVTELRPYFDGNATVALLGASGSGKSTLANALIGEQIQDTARVRTSDSRGRHTTTSRQLLPLPDGGVVLDTPGLRSLGLWVTEGGLDRAFPEIETLGAACRFRDCSHTTEPGCAVVAAVGAGELDERRLASYRRLAGELAQLDQGRTEQRQRQGEGRRPSPRRSHTRRRSGR